MYKLLIVDDEWHVVNSLKAELNTEQLEISDIYTAYNIRQAKEVFLNHSVDIMLCDIEMPQGSGLELLEWVKEHKPETETIFLTSHADFKYAKQAMQLGGSDYLLKPVPDEELENAIAKAKEKIHTNSQHSRIQKLWDHHHPVIMERFWMDLLQQTIPLSPAAIRKTIEERDLPITESMEFLPILINVRRWYKSMSLRDEKIMEYALRNSAEEMIAGLGGQILTVDNGVLLVILAWNENSEEEPESITSKCEDYIQSCNRFFYCDLSCYIGNWVFVHEMVESWVQLRNFEKNNVTFDNKVFMLTGVVPSSLEPVPLPEMSGIAEKLAQGNGEAIYKELTDYFNRFKDGSYNVNAQLLQQFHQNFLQTVYFSLHSKGKKAHEYLCDPESMELSRNATRSLADMLIWIRHTVMKVIEAPKETEAEPTASVVQSVKHFIVTHLEQSDLSREEIAKHAFLNPDYLARVFKKETGIAIIDYLVQERVKKAKELLNQTDMSVGNIAMAVGYSHFSHFSKMFKKHTGLNPNEYRQLNEK
ncbi:response regulator [Paenibacillus sp. LHD-117]|uniref:response regulator n=1 Tax=Paenibacillus sp. LHD-117 TaxID=3071412 RepID=UPI0027DF55D9|nr:response regulator [Paenibacillus sp. LHD-117]MDQ6420177.1 response regulator [Paenibacillus sp. LHD-117]